MSARFISAVVLLTAFCEVLSCYDGREKPPKEFSVCDLMRNLKSQRNKMVRVRGELYHSREAVALGTPECNTPFITRGRRWPTAVDLVFSVAERSDSEEPPAPFVTESSTIARMSAAVTDLERSGCKRKVTLVLTGFLRVRRTYVKMGNGRGNGYGFLASYPAQLVIRTVDDVKVEPCH